MKKLLTFLLIFVIVTALASCEALENILGDTDYSDGIISGALDGMYPTDDDADDNTDHDNTDDDNTDDSGDNGFEASNPSGISNVNVAFLFSPML